MKLIKAEDDRVMTLSRTDKDVAEVWQRAKVWHGARFGVRPVLDAVMSGSTLAPRFVATLVADGIAQELADGRCVVVFNDTVEVVMDAVGQAVYEMPLATYHYDIEVTAALYCSSVRGQRQIMATAQCVLPVVWPVCVGMARDAKALYDRSASHLAIGRLDARGVYHLEAAVDGECVMVLIPHDGRCGRVERVTMGGFEVVMDEMAYVTVEGITYRMWRSEVAYDRGTQIVCCVM